MEDYGITGAIDLAWMYADARPEAASELTQIASDATLDPVLLRRRGAWSRRTIR